MNPDLSLDAFLNGAVAARDFHHADHVRTAFAILRRHPFRDAMKPYCTALQEMAARAGNPGAYHETLTVAFLSVIAERMAQCHHAGFDGFAAGNPDLMENRVLDCWYAPARLHSELARKTFLLPDPAIAR